MQHCRPHTGYWVSAALPACATDPAWTKAYPTTIPMGQVVGMASPNEGLWVWHTSTYAWGFRWGAQAFLVRAEHLNTRARRSASYLCPMAAGAVRDYCVVALVTPYPKCAFGVLKRWSYEVDILQGGLP